MSSGRQVSQLKQPFGCLFLMKQHSHLPRQTQDKIMKLETRGVFSAEATPKTLYLHPGGGLTMDAPTELDTYDEWLR
jgi:hypothetical protein